MGALTLNTSTKQGLIATAYWFGCGRPVPGPSFLAAIIVTIRFSKTVILEMPPRECGEIKALRSSPPTTSDENATVRVANPLRDEQEGVRMPSGCQHGGGTRDDSFIKGECFYYVLIVCREVWDRGERGRGQAAKVHIASKQMSVDFISRSRTSAQRLLDLMCMLSYYYV